MPFRKTRKRKIVALPTIADRTSMVPRMASIAQTDHAVSVAFGTDVDPDGFGCLLLTLKAVCRHFQQSAALFRKPSENVVDTHSRSFSHQQHVVDSCHSDNCTFIKTLLFTL